jgi:hypothetical protein
MLILCDHFCQKVSNFFALFVDDELLQSHKGALLILIIVQEL